VALGLKEQIVKMMKTLRELMIELDGADPETVNRIARKEGSLPVRLAMLGLASSRKDESPLWWGYPPGVFLGYKWSGKPLRDLVVSLAEHVRGLGYRAFLDVENLDEDADAYFQIPQFIASMQDCEFYVLLLTELSADMLSARKGKTTWIFDEYQHAVRLVNSGRLFIVPVLLEPEGMIDAFRPDNVIDLTVTPRDFGKLDDILAPNPIKLSEAEMKELTATVAQFDKLFLDEQWDASDYLLRGSPHLAHTFDHEFRRMLHSIYTANQRTLDAVLGRLHSVYGAKIVYHIYKGYCARHRIPNRATITPGPGEK
jgi:hypothetical protein